ncbi:MAG TPA: NAD-dependent dehydratase [Chloroflexi bacterium]|nr:NAD-dependent dehydratase [Chloroflexota bacterium]HCU99218.1 NAD-dependent dehydratase [Chloroflexota bacterium]|tara:strand:+ start:1415 stop:2407 length:993 start_codon:yes stop_codon:yes gene_type:complete
MKAIVTGGAGFIGSHLVDRLLDMGCNVTVIDNLSTGRLDNLQHVIDHKSLQFYEQDITNWDEIQDLFLEVDWVFHLAALADIVPSIQKPMDYYRTNVDGTMNIVEASRKAGVKKFIYIASSSCYGIPDTYPTSEKEKIRIEYPYALTKYLGEQIVLHWNKVYKFPALSLRFFNVYGPRSRTSGTYGAVFGVFLAQKIAGKPFTIVGDGKQTRDFTFVSDVVDAIVIAATSKLEGEVFNVGSGIPHSINELVELLQGEVVYIPKRPGEPDITCANVTKIREKLNWASKVSFEEGVGIMLDNIEYWRNAPVWNSESIAEATEEWFSFLGSNE